MPETPQYTIRVRTKKGVIRITNLTENSNIIELKSAISSQGDVDCTNVKILKGYPPKAIDSTNENSTLGSNNIANGELLTVEEAKEGDSTVKSTQNVSFDSKSEDIKGVLTRKVVPANNSCLFTSVYYVMQNGELDLDCQESMRQFIAQTVKNDPITFNEGILGKSNNEYCKWIMMPSSWGGSIEIMILSRYYKCEICVVDIRTGRIDRFGEDCAYNTRVLIIYDGIHFDPLYLDMSKIPCAKNKTKFKTNGDDDFVLMQAYKLANEAKNAKQFVDVNNFKLRCLVCQEPLKGQKEAQEHAEKTKHINFGEY